MIEFPDAEKLLRDYLRVQLPAVFGVNPVVSTFVPNPRPANLVRVLRTGGTSRFIVIDRAQMTFDCWAADEDQAAELAGRVRTLVLDMPDLHAGPTKVSLCEELAAPSNQPDVDGNPRYVLSAVLDIRGKQR